MNIEIYEEKLSEVIEEKLMIKGLLPLGIRFGRIDFLPGLIKCEELLEILSVYISIEEEERKDILDFSFNEIGETIFDFCCEESKIRLDEVQILIVTDNDVVSYVMTQTLSGTIHLFKVSNPLLIYSEWLDAVPDYGQKEVKRYSGLCIDGIEEIQGELGEIEYFFDGLYDGIERVRLKLYQMKWYMAPVLSEIEKEEPEACDTQVERELPFTFYMNQSSRSAFPVGKQIDSPD